MPRYRYSRQLGSGTYGTVYECMEVDEHDDLVQDDLAIKILRDEWLDDEDCRERFRREVRLLRGLKHPNILPVVYSNLSAEPPWIVMPRAPSNLADELALNRAASREWALATFRGILEGMAYAHDQDVLHRDLKPANILFLDEGPAISDFGMGKHLTAASLQKTLTNSPVGTMAYMAPEMWTDPRRSRKASDVYSLGKLLWELLANRPPQPWAPDLNVIDDEALRSFVARCCDQEPSLRWRDAGQVLRAWDSVVRQLGPSRSPIDVAQEIVYEWGRTPVGPDIKHVRRLEGLLHRFRAEEQLYYELIPSLPEDLIEQYVVEMPTEFALMLETYVEHIGQDLPFSYCDDVAEFYATVFRATEDDDVKRTVLSRMLTMGARHNRYPVADVVRELLWSVDDQRTARLVAKVIQDTPSAMWYHHWQLFERPLAKPIRRAFDRLLEPRTEAA